MCDFSMIANEAIQLCYDISKFSSEQKTIQRFSLSDEMDQCHNFLNQTFSPFFEIEKDRVGNILFKSKRYSKNKNTLLFGSHLDTVKNAGKYDGILGVMVGLIIGRELHNSKYNIDVVGFSDEEGGRFGGRFIGSLNFVGNLPNEYMDLKDKDKISLGDAIAQADHNIKSDFSSYLLERKPIFIEPHIEQGLSLDKDDKNIGIVTCISGQAVSKITFIGKTAHAVQKWDRKDSLLAAAEFITKCKQLALMHEHSHITIGNISNHPNLSNVVSNKTTVQVDVRHTSDDIRKSILDKISDMVKGVSSTYNVDHSIKFSDRNSAYMDKEIYAAMEGQLLENGIKYKSMQSYAGHDSVIISNYVPTCLLFLRDRKGISHHPDEYVHANDLIELFRLLFIWVSSENKDFKR